MAEYFLNALKIYLGNIEALIMQINQKFKR